MKRNDLPDILYNVISEMGGKQVLLMCVNTYGNNIKMT